MLLSNTLSFRPLKEASDGGSVPVSTLRLKSRKVRPVNELLSVVKLPSADGTVPFRPKPTRVIALTPPTVTVEDTAQ